MSDTPAELPKQDAGEDSPQRKDRRMRVHLPVEVRGTDRNGQRFDERTQCSDLCRQGAAFPLSHDLEIGAEVDIFIPITRPGHQGAADFSTQARVRHVRTAEGTRVIGVEFIGSHFRTFSSESVEPA
jgi:hypothetical protein